MCAERRAQNAVCSIQEENELCVRNLECRVCFCVHGLFLSFHLSSYVESLLIVKFFELVISIHARSLTQYGLFIHQFDTQHSTFKKEIYVCA